MKTIVFVGGSNTDLVWTGARLPRPGETVANGEFARYAGGKAANQAVAAARAGARAVFVGARGDDEFGRAAAAGLRREGIDVRYFRVKPGLPSGVAVILVGGRNRQNLIGVARSANNALTAADVRAAAPVLRRAAVVVSELETSIEAVETAAGLAEAGGAQFLLTPAPVRRLPGSLLRRVTVLAPNETEAEALTGFRDPRAAAERLWRAGCRHVVVTLGARGALLFDADGARRIPAPRVKPVDTVGAGDCFSGWLAAGMAEGCPLEEAVARAVRAASISVTRAGAQPSMPRRSEVLTDRRRSAR